MAQGIRMGPNGRRRPNDMAPMVRTAARPDRGSPARLHAARQRQILGEATPGGFEVSGWPWRVETEPAYHVGSAACPLIRDRYGSVIAETTPWTEPQLRLGNAFMMAAAAPLYDSVVEIVIARETGALPHWSEKQWTLWTGRAMLAMTLARGA